MGAAREGHTEVVLRNPTRWMEVGAFALVVAVGIVAVVLQQSGPVWSRRLSPPRRRGAFGIRSAMAAILITEAGVVGRTAVLTRTVPWTEIDHFATSLRRNSLGAVLTSGRWANLMDRPEASPSQSKVTFGPPAGGTPPTHRS